jgi:glycosyltransferase involved in cell wall biosynthesis
VAVFCPEAGRGEPGVATEEDGVHVYRVGQERRGRLAVFLSALGAGGAGEAFAAVLAAERPEIVHLQHLMGLSPQIGETLRAAGIPYAITLHDYWYGCANAQLLTNYDESLCHGPNPRFTNCGHCALARAGLGGVAPAGPLVAPLMARRNRLLAPVFSGAAAVLAATPFVRDAHAAMGLPVERVHILPLGADVTAAGVAAAGAARQTRAGSTFHVGYVGGLSRQKGIHVLVAAFNGLPDEARLSIYGDATAFPNYAAELRRAATHPGIHFAGPLSRAALWPALGELDALVVPTLWYETYSLIVQEAFAAGVPVVASRIGVLPDVVRDGVDGRLFPPGNADALRAVLLELMRDPAQLAALRAARPPVMTMDEHAARLEAIYRAYAGRQ